MDLKDWLGSFSDSNIPTFMARKSRLSGFPANAMITLSNYQDWYGETDVTTDSSGNFTTTMNIPREPGPAPGPGTIEVYTGNGQATIWHSVTFQ
ncbi:hypothetical protein [uncultured Arthrobacter sp.]|uniref:hypothetical protein n=1 Tax=uncultured Arthrobacter sp. TaxID=114050 RepID=UPI0028D79815|nr:hypothetical protein [uncultured Arthrobacter sp.]